MLKWINKLIDGYILGRCIEANFWLTSKDQEYLKKLGKDAEFIAILDKIASSNVYTSITCKSVEGLAERNGFLKAIGFLKSVMSQEIEKKIDRRTNKKID